jgi:hypothetical protein
MPNHSLNDTHMGSFKVYLDSSKASVKLGHTNSNCLFYLDNVIECPVDTHLMLSLTSCQIPVSFYNVTNNNNSITLESSTTVAGFPVRTETVVSLLPKNYDTETLVQAVNERLVATGNPITCSFDDQSLKFTFSSLTRQITIKSTTMKKELGIVTVPTVSAYSYTCPRCCNLSGPQSVYVMLNNLSIESWDSRADGDLNGVLAKVDIDCSFGDYIGYKTIEEQIVMLADRTISHFNISLTDESIELLDMNGIDWTIEMTVHYSKKRKPTVDVDYIMDDQTGVPLLKDLDETPDESDNVSKK